MREVNEERVRFLLAGLAKFGAGPKGITREAPESSRAQPE